jgi:N-methylhydantoinase B
MMIDPVVFQILMSRLSGIVQEMQDAVFRTGYSTIIRESQDASCTLVDVEGNAVANFAGLPSHTSCMAAIVRAIVATYGTDIHRGDAFITNHPFDAQTPHSMDMAAVTPVFANGRLIAFCGSIAHKSDLGGVVPGTSYGLARELFQEGIQYPPVRYMQNFEVVRDIDAILRANSRTPNLILGDLRGQIGSARIGEERVVALVERYGIENILAAFAHKQDLTERRTRAAVASWPDGVHEAEAFVDNDGVNPDKKVRFHVRIEKHGERIVFDFRASDDQAPGAINIGPALTRSCAHYGMIAMIDKELPNDGGLTRVVEIITRPGSVMDPYFPAARSAYTPSTNAATTMVLEALSGFVPSRLMASNGGTGGMSIAGRRPDGSSFNQYELIGSSWGAIVGKDGASGTTVLNNNTKTAPIEILESEFPTRLKRMELIQDCGGPGTYRGGLSQRRVYEILTDDAQLALRGGKHKTPAKGVAGGMPGRLGQCLVNPATDAERSLPNRFAGERLRRGDIVCLEKAGGGGLGDPRERPYERVRDDVLDGYVSRESALRDYGIDPARLDADLARWEGGHAAVGVAP